VPNVLLTGVLLAVIRKTSKPLFSLKIDGLSRILAANFRLNSDGTIKRIVMTSEGVKPAE
jgi:hypothetical protein